jgi:hypothetical protein
MNSAVFTSPDTLHPYILIQTFLIILLFNISIFTQIKYVSSGGSDFPNVIGDLDHPFRTVTYALSFKQSGQTLTLYVLGGEYHEYVEISTSGTGSNDQIIIQGVPGDIRGRVLEKPIFYGSENIFGGKDAVFKWGSQQAHYVTLENIIVENCTANTDMRGIWINGNNNLIKNCEVRNIIRSGIVIQGNYNTIEDNVVENITGYITAVDTLKGNNISVETYGIDLTSRPSDNNVIQRNILRDNPTHFGVNIFPNTGDPAQPVMFNNKIYSNYIDNTGGGIYTRYQRNLEIINNIIVNSTYSELWATEGSAVTFDDKTGAPHPLPFDGGTIKIYNNTMVHNERSGIRNITSTGLKIFNNILVDQAQTGNNGHVSFDQQFENTEINNNLYNGTGRWRWGTQIFENLNFIGWQKIFDQNGLTAPPLFVTFEGIPYAIDYDSPAKNRGTYLTGVSTDKFGNSRPYWNNDYDIGAYEIEDTQLKFGIFNTTTTNVIHTLTSYGTYWQRNTDGTYSISSDQGLTTAVCTTASADVSNDLHLMPGVEYKWLDRSNNNSGKRLAAAIYKVTSNHPDNQNAHCYIDLRDAPANLNLYLRYNHFQKKYEYNQNGNWRNYIEPGQVLRIWDVNSNGMPNYTPLGPEFWQKSLVQVGQSGQHPFFIWGPNGSAPYILRRRAGGNYYNFPSSYLLEKGDTSVVIGQPPPGSSSDLYYSVRDASNDNTEEILVWKSNIEKENTINMNYAFNLNQNYPNPFNPSTIISFSVANEENIVIKIFDLLGNEVACLLNDRMEPGENSINFNASRLSSGIYFCKMLAGNYVSVKKMQLIK